MNFYPHTSIEVPRQSNGLIASDKVSLTALWARVDEKLEEGLSCATSASNT